MPNYSQDFSFLQKIKNQEISGFEVKRIIELEYNFCEYITSNRSPFNKINAILLAFNTLIHSRCFAFDIVWLNNMKFALVSNMCN